MAASTQSYPHLLWAFGHIVVLASTISTLLTFSNRAYSLAYSGAIVSWGIVVYKSLGTPQASKAWLKRALLDENVQYLLLALYWYFQKPIYLTLIPFATFSLFHTLTFIRTSVLPKGPATPAPTPGAARVAPLPTTLPQKVSKFIQTWVKVHYEQAMLFVSFTEVILVFGRLLLGAITFQNSFLAPLFFAHFLRLRYYLSPPTRQAFAWVSSQVDSGIGHPSCPAPVKQVVNIIRDLIIRYSETVLSVPNAAPAAPAAAAAPAPVAGAVGRGARRDAAAR